MRMFVIAALFVVVCMIATTPVMLGLLAPLIDQHVTSVLAGVLG